MGAVPDSRLPVRRQLEDLLSIIAPPTAPPAIPYRAQIRGLALLDAGLRMTHVTRVAEVLKPQNRTSLSRMIAADLDLTQLSPPHPRPAEHRRRGRPARSPSSRARSGSPGGSAGSAGSAN